MVDVITSIRTDLDYDKVMMEQIKEEIRQLEMELRYYQGKFDGRNEALSIINGRDECQPHDST